MVGSRWLIHRSRHCFPRRGWLGRRRPISPPRFRAVLFHEPAGAESGGDPIDQSSGREKGEGRATRRRVTADSTKAHVFGHVSDFFVWKNCSSRMDAKGHRIGSRAERFGRVFSGNRDGREILLAGSPRAHRARSASSCVVHPPGFCARGGGLSLAPLRGIQSSSRTAPRGLVRERVVPARERRGGKSRAVRTNGKKWGILFPPRGNVIGWSYPRILDLARERGGGAPRAREARAVVVVLEPEEVDVVEREVIDAVVSVVARGLRRETEGGGRVSGKKPRERRDARAARDRARTKKSRKCHRGARARGDGRRRARRTGASVARAFPRNLVAFASCSARSTRVIASTVSGLASPARYTTRRTPFECAQSGFFRARPLARGPTRARARAPRAPARARVSRRARRR